jgi:hypothetical protein
MALKIAQCPKSIVNLFWFGTVKRLRKIQPRRGETILAQGVTGVVEPWVKWKK